MPVKTLLIADFYKISVIANSDVDFLRPSEYGCCVCDSAGKWIIIYNDRETRGCIRFTIAHELGHIVLRHNSAHGHRECAERQADEFAAQLLAPAAVLRAAGITDARGIEKICDIPRTVAGYRAEKISHGDYFALPAEKKLSKAFKPWILQQKNRPIRAELGE